MAKPTLSELVHDLAISKTAILAQVEALTKDVARLDAAHSRTADSLNDLRR